MTRMIFFDDKTFAGFKVKCGECHNGTVEYSPTDPEIPSYTEKCERCDGEGTVILEDGVECEPCEGYGCCDCWGEGQIPPQKDTGGDTVPLDRRMTEE